MGYVNKEDLTIGELNSLCPTYGLLDDIEFQEKEYYKDNMGRLWEVGYSFDNKLSERLETLRKIQKTKEILEYFNLEQYYGGF